MSAPAEGAPGGLQLAAVYNGGPPALVRHPAVLTLLSTPGIMQLFAQQVVPDASSEKLCSLKNGRPEG